MVRGTNKNAIYQIYFSKTTSGYINFLWIRVINEKGEVGKFPKEMGKIPLPYEKKKVTLHQRKSI